MRFDFAGQPRSKSRFWLLIENGWGEVCSTCPGAEDLAVRAGPDRFVCWHMGQLNWAEEAADGGIQVEGPRVLARAFPGWNNRSHFAHVPSR
jgi:hypothetical protein